MVYWKEERERFSRPTIIYSYLNGILERRERFSRPTIIYSYLNGILERREIDLVGLQLFIVT